MVIAGSLTFGVIIKFDKSVLYAIIFLFINYVNKGIEFVHPGQLQLILALTPNLKINCEAIPVVVKQSPLFAIKLKLILFEKDKIEEI